MISVLTITITSCIALIVLVLAKPCINIRGRSFNIYWFAPLIGSIILIIIGALTPKELIEGLTYSGEMNPIKILILFLSMTIMSVFLDNAGFFKFLAGRAVSGSKNGQIRLFNILYLMVSVLTIFTSNDIIILTFTPFICYFAFNAEINPMPYLIGEFIAANTWSMALIIGNPTNIYLASSFGVSFFKYTEIMLLPTVAAGVISFMLLRLIFKNDLKKEITYSKSATVLEDKGLAVIGLIHLALCIVLLSISSYIDLPMWIISLGFCISLLLISLIYLTVNSTKPKIIVETFKRTPLDVIPFVISMFALILACDKYGISEFLANIIDVKTNENVFTFGFASFATSNIINNIPMSVLFSSIIQSVSESGRTAALYSSVIGSNIGAFLTPIGALAGIMWMNLLSHHGVKLSFFKFIKYNALIAILSLLSALTLLYIVI